MGKQHIIELNGKRYDAITGKVLVNDTIIKSSTQKSNIKPAAPNAQAHTPRLMDGFSFPSHKPEKSKTLMRHVVHKPVPKKIQEAKSSAPDVPKVHAYKQASDAKLARAQIVPKSSLVQRFGKNTPVSEFSQSTSSQPATIARVQKIATAAAVKSSPVERGMANATSHEQAKLKRPRTQSRLARKLRISPRMLSGASLALAGLLIGGFFAYQNVPNLNMRLATARSGVKGSLPAYQPAGFGISGTISYKPGQIIIGYKSNSDDRNFNITQSTSSWDSESLLNQYVALNRRDYQTVQDRGKTVYIYDGSNATWVDGGIWYKVEGNSQLNSEQLQSIANSL